MDTPHFVPIAARMSWVTTGNIAAIIDRQKVLTADALEEYMVYVFAKYEINAIKMIVMQLPKSTPANAGKTQCVSGPLDHPNQNRDIGMAALKRMRSKEDQASK